MAKTSDVVKDATTELQTAIKELKQGDEEDLGELANKLYAVSERADKAASLLEKANQALEGSEGEQEQNEEQQQPENDEEQQVEEAGQRKSR